MALTRRNAIIGLGILVIGAGIIGGTGAFTSVQAERTVDVEVAGDKNANLAFQPGAGNAGQKIVSFTDTEGVDTIEFTETDVNENAITTYDGAFKVTNNAGDGKVTLSVDGSTESGSFSAVDFIVDANDNSNVNSDVNLETGSVDIGEGNAVTIDIEVDTINGNLPDSAGNSGTVTFKAN